MKALSIAIMLLCVAVISLGAISAVQAMKLHSAVSDISSLKQTVSKLQAEQQTLPNVTRFSNTQPTTAPVENE